MKGNILVILLIGTVVVLSLGSAGYLFLQNRQLQSQLVKTPSPAQNPASVPTVDPMVNWKTITVETALDLGLADYQIKLPVGWWRIEHSSAFQATETFRDIENAAGTFTYQLLIQEMKNVDQKTGQPYANIQSVSGLPYESPVQIIAGQQAIKVLPRAGSEMDYKVLFFPKDRKNIISIELDTPRDGSKVEEGKLLFDQILSTFKFL